MPDYPSKNSTEPTITYRSSPSDQRELIIVSGANHKVGHKTDTFEFYKKLEKHANEHFNVKSIDYRWCTQDNITIDRCPTLAKQNLNQKEFM